jgi:cyanophycinase-like exopeptidase
MKEPSTKQDQSTQLGKVLLLSSGETSNSGRRILEGIFAEMGPTIRVAILETPAGFELNSTWVAERVGDYIKSSLQNYSPYVAIVPARRQDGPFSTNDSSVLAPMLDANYIYLGAGSPTYLTRHLKDSLAINYLVGRHRMGATLCFTSAAAISFGAKTLPVYEIFKAGHDPYWDEGLDFFGLFGLDLAIVTHWNNNDGGDRVDTRRCFVGQPRMERLRKSLPSSTLVLGIDEHTGVLLDFQAEQCQVQGIGNVTIEGSNYSKVFKSGTSFPITELGPYHAPPEAQGYGTLVAKTGDVQDPDIEPPQEVLTLITKREEARQARNWSGSDALREQIERKGFEVKDTPEGPRWRCIGE